MRKLIAFSAAGLLAFAAAGVSIPLASPRQLQASPLARGETARVERIGPGMDSRGFTVEGGLYAELYVGGQNGPLRVCDGSALRGYRTRELEKDEFSVSADAAFVYNPATGVYTLNGMSTNAIIITAKAGVVIESVTMNIEAFGAGLLAPQVDTRYTLDGPVCRIVMNVVTGTGLTAKDARVYVREIGEIDWYNDLHATRFLMKDKLGMYDFNDLRRWARDLYNGNRGEDWAKYKARDVVRMDGNGIMFTADNRITARITTQSNLVFQAGQRDAITVEAQTNATPAFTIFQITDIDVFSGSDTVLDFTTDIADFDSSRLFVSTADEFNGIWYGISSSDFTVSNLSTSGGVTSGTVTIPAGHTGKHRFYKLMYGALATDAVKVTLHGKVVVKDMLIIKGTDSKFYKINISGGVITAQEVNP